ncbi:Predicted lipase/calmodulin-binding heat-shock protein [Phaffia rhodozyma]|uniref:sn-1-specific diacylglycerol lipase n=1 Tax=Phaffia rhodozyma TaxID=264483 RepID=A0A0F7SSJ8_PHARH|nr:Predicted lipase/calmodulin-binding heat-shock protein [Phaffia rhodozyma]
MDKKVLKLPLNKKELKGIDSSRSPMGTTDVHKETIIADPNLAQAGTTPITVAPTITTTTSNHSGCLSDDDDSHASTSSSTSNVVTEMASVSSPLSQRQPALLPLQMISTALSIGPTLLPPRLSNLITALSLATKVSLRATAFFIEAILESARYSTSLGFGLTRRALISAISSARTFYVVKEGLDWAGEKVAGKVVPGLKGRDDAFLNVLDRYTNLGIYLITHTLTLAELFAMSGFYLTFSTLHTGIAAAQESVSLFDGIFGSNETSRALASIVTLVRREFGKDERSKKGTISGLTALTKALTAFACLQNATWRRTAGSIKQRVLVDCVVVGELKQNLEDPASNTQHHRANSGSIQASKGPSEPVNPVSSPVHSSHQRRPSRYSIDEEPSYLLTDVRSVLADQESTTPTRSDQHPDRPPPETNPYVVENEDDEDISGENGRGNREQDDEDEMVRKLSILVGDDPDDVVDTFRPRDTERRQPWIERRAPKRTRSDLSRDSHEGFKRDRLSSGEEWDDTEDVEEGDSLYEITEQITEHITETRTVEHYNPETYQGFFGLGKDNARLGSSPSSNQRSIGSNIFETPSSTEEEQDWVEVEATLGIAPAQPDGPRNSYSRIRSRIPISSEPSSTSSSSPISSTASSPSTSSSSSTSTIKLSSVPISQPTNRRSIASQAYNDAFQHPHKNSARVQVILKTITRKLLEKKRTVRRLPTEETNRGEYMLETELSVEGKDGRAIKKEHDETSDELVGELKIKNRLDPMTPPPSPEVYRAPSSFDRRDSSKGNGGDGSRWAVDWENRFNRATEMDREEEEEVRQLTAFPLDPRAQMEQHYPSPSTSTDSGESDSSMLTSTSISTLWPSKSPRSFVESQSEERVSLTPSKKVKRCPKSACADPMSDGSLESPATVSTRSAFVDLDAELPSINKLRVQDDRSQSSSNAETPDGGRNGYVSDSSSPRINSRAHVRHGTTEQGHTKTKPRVHLPPPLSPSSNCKTRSVLTQESHYSSTTQANPDPEAYPAGLFPYDHLVRNIHKFCRYSSAAYGQNFLRILGMGQTDFMFPSTGRYHANSWAFAQHTNIPIDALLLSSYADPTPSAADEKLSPLVHYIAVDHDAKAIVLTCRGTLGLSDVLVDLTCEYKPIPVEGGEPDGIYMAHSGMLYSASRLMNSSSTVHETIKQALIDYPAYGLVLTGHSLGGGVAALLSILWSCPSEYFSNNLASHESVGPYPPIGTKFVTNISSGLPAGRPIHAYVYGPPCVASSDLAKHTRDLITCVVQGNDIVPSLSLGTLRDFRNVALTLSDEGNIAEEIVGRVVGIYQRRLREKYGPVLLKGSTQQDKPVPTLKALQAAEQAERPEVVITREELAKGRTRNYAKDTTYQDSTLRPEYPGPGEARDDRMEAEDEDEDDKKMLDDWFFSLIKTMRADMDNDKLYPPGRVYQMEHWTVFVTDKHIPGSRHSVSPDKKTSKHNSSHKEAHRIVLKAVEDVEKMFGELTFSRSMLQDHVPSRYEQGTQLLYDGLFGMW